MGDFAREKDHQTPAGRQHVIVDIAVQVHAQMPTMLGQPALVEIDHGRNHAPVIIPKAVQMLEVKRTGRVERKVAFKVLQAQKKPAIHGDSQAFH